MKSHPFCFGLGYVGKAWAEHVAASGNMVTGTTRSGLSNINNVSAIKFSEEFPVSSEILFQHTHFLITIPPVEKEDIVLKLHRNDFVEHPNLHWIGYLSSTGVYGDYQGGWVDERSECHPSSPVTINRYNAELDWMSLYKDYSLPVHIFRLSGIYGPGRSMVEQVLSGQAKRIDKPGQYFSRVHVEDIVQTVIASMEKPQPGEIYNFSDDEPCSSRYLVEYVCDKLQKPYPPLIPFEEAELTEMGKRFYQDNRRVSNGKIKEELGVTLKYPTYKEGLKAIID